ncbi:aldehyde dehydrogenase family protein [Halosegnis rubeus]|uniref:Aldehyde dehydrogenase family protein n=2 Tax=Halosegnis rubeus TaxID=2212850 RepID=A0A5N5UM60_9EURY|nr:aldehyde dehydrogenase family protein [Halosegnis rubeus]
MSTGTSEQDPERVVRQCIETGRDAMEQIQQYNQSQTDDLARAAAWAVYQENRAESLVQSTLKATEFGNGADKREKLRSRVKGILHDTLGQPSVGEIPTDRDGVVEIAKPVGVIGGLVPSTNPAPSVANLAILALKGRNALVISASPSGIIPATEAVEYIRNELARIGAPRDLVQVLPQPASKAKSNALLEQADLLQVTGSAANVAAGQTAGTPNYSVSEGNPIALVDTGADLGAVAERVGASAGYDNGTTCIAESCLVAPTEVYAELRQALADQGGYLCTREETDLLRETLFTDGHLNRDVIGLAAETLAAEAGIENSEISEPDLLIVEAGDIDEDPLVTECLSPILATVDVSDFETGLDVTRRILAREGAGHSVAVHTNDSHRAVNAGRTLDTCRVVVNQPNLGSSGTFENGLTHTLSMGGGTWAGNQLDENLSYRHFIQTTRVAFRQERDEPSAADVFGSYEGFDD